MRVIDAAVGSVWAMEEAALVTLLEIAYRENDLSPQALEAYRSGSLENAERARVRDGVAILYVEGPLFKRANLMTEISGATSYDVLMRDLTVALDDYNVRAIMLAIDSPGGEAAGCSAFAAAVLAARARKPVVAYASDIAASAAYWIASACSSIVIGASAAVGSIGVRCTIPDTRARDERSGVRRFDFVSSQSPFKVSDPATDDGAARIKARVDALAQVFVEAVAANRDVSVAQVLDSFGRGDVLIGAAAVAAGMADGIGTFESTLADLSNLDPRTPFGSSRARMGALSPEIVTMPTTEEMNAAVETARTEATAAASAAHATASAAAVEAARAETSAAVQTAERDRVSGLMDATVAGYEADRDEAIKTGSSVDAFKALIVGKEHAKAKDRASAVEEDTKRNALVPAPKTTGNANAEDAAVNAILSARTLALK